MGDFKMGSKTVMSQSGTSNPTWGANAPTGAILRVISVSKASNFSTTETSFQTITGLTQAITLSSSSNKVFVMASFPLVESSGAASGDAVSLGLFRESTQIMEVIN